MHGKNNIGLICMTLLLYVLNQIYKTSFENEAIRWFMCCYFNDIIGGVTFLAYTNLMLKFQRLELKKLHHIEAYMLMCGLFWEYITPLFRADTVSDIWDVAAYIGGGMLYWGIMRVYNVTENRGKK